MISEAPSRASVAHGALLRLIGVGEQQISPDEERKKSTLTFAVIGLVIMLAFALVFVAMPEPRLQLQGCLQFIEALLLLVPAVLIARRSRYPERAENFLVGSGVIIFLTITLIGGFAGDAVYWTFVFPYLVFFLKGQRVGWAVGILYAIGAPLLMIYSSSHWGLWVYDARQCAYYGMAYLFSVLTAAHFNLLRSVFQARLHELVEKNTGEIRRHLESLQYNATHDVPTGLLNRQGIIEALRKSFTGEHRTGACLFVVSIRFRRVIELASIVGIDSVNGSLARLSGALGQIIPGIAAIGRTQQDELTLLLLAASDDPVAVEPVYGIEYIAGLSDMGEFSIHDEFVFGVSLQLLSDIQPDAEALLRKAEQALLYASKNRQRSQFYDYALSEHFVQHNTRYEKIREAMRAETLILHYQPQIDLRRNAVTGAEALVRWFDAKEGWIPPDVFIPVIESTGLLHKFSIWTIQQAMRDCASWQKELPGLTVSINLSADALHDADVVRALELALQEYKVAPALVIIELTESVMLKSPETAIEMMQRIVALGVSLSIDDYGAGFSSLTYVKQLPAHELKIDKSFIADLVNSAQDQAIVASTIELGHDFGLKVLAEGVETEQALALLKEAGCDLGQGWLFSRALPVAEFRAWSKRFTQLGAIG